MIHRKSWLVSFLNFITFGFFLKHLAKKQEQQKVKRESYKVQMSFQTEELLAHLGGIDNIINSQATLSKIKIFYKDKEKLAIAEISKLKEVSGIMLSQGAINIILGDAAKQIDLYLKAKSNNEQ